MILEDIVKSYLDTKIRSVGHAGTSRWWRLEQPPCLYAWIPACAAMIGLFLGFSTHDRPGKSTSRTRTLFGGILLTALFFPAVLFGAPASKTGDRQPTKTGPSARSVKMPWEEKWKSILATARQEGTITIFSSSGPQVRTEVANAFKAKYGIGIEYVSARPPELAQKVTTERRGGIYAADVFIGGSTLQVVMLKPAGILEPIEPALILPEVVDSKIWRGGEIPFFDRDHTSIGFIGTFTSFLDCNTSLVKSKEITSFRDLLKPQWKGKMVLQDANLGGNSLWWLTFLSAKVWGPKETRSFLEKLRAQDVAVVNDPRQQAEWLARGKYSVGLATRLETTMEFRKAGAPIADVRVSEGGLITPGGGGVGLATKAPHPNAAVVFLNWLLGKEGQTVFAKAMGAPSSRLDVSREGFEHSVFPDPWEKTAREDEDFVTASTKVKAMYNEVFSGK